MAVQYSIQKMVSDGTLSTITLGIQYLQRNDIYIRIAGGETPQSGAPSGYTWSFIDNTTLQILPIVPNDLEVVVYRRTDVDAMYNIYSQNAQFDEATIDENNQQLLYIAQEYLEQGLPGAGVDTIEFLRDDGINTYYRIKRTDGTYSDEFAVPSVGTAYSIVSVGAMRAACAALGLVLVTGSFESGAVLNTPVDVVLQESSGKVFYHVNGASVTIQPGSTPASNFNAVGISEVRNSVGIFNGDIDRTLLAFGSAVVMDDITLTKDLVLKSGETFSSLGVTRLGGYSIKTLGTEEFPFQYYSGSTASPVLVIASPINQGSSSITLVNASTIQEGDLLWLQNGYCDFWRFFEDLTIQEVDKLYSTDNPIYFGEHVRVLSVSGNTVNLQSKTRFAYQPSPTLTGLLSYENALPQYAGLNFSNVRRASISDVSITGKFDFSSGGTIQADAVDGMTLDIDIYGHLPSNTTSPRTFKQVRFSKCKANSLNAKGPAVLLQQCSGAPVTGSSYGWVGGSDTPYTTMLHSQNDIENIVLEATPSANAIGAAYINAGGNGKISNVKSSNSRYVALCGFSKGVTLRDLSGVNVDIAVGNYISVDCSCDNAELDGYFQISASTPSSPSTVTASRTLRYRASNVLRKNDLGYGLIKIDELTSGALLDNISAPSTDMLISVGAKGVEYAVGGKNDKAVCTNMRIKNLLRNGGYYDGALQNNVNYPVVKVSGIVYGDATIGSNIVADEYDLFVWGSATVGSGSTVRLSGVIGGNLSPITPSASFTCFIDAKDLRIYGTTSGFQPAPVTGQSWFPKGMCMTDFTTMKRWYHSGAFGTPGPMVVG